jgi:hypothetical protein
MREWPGVKFAISTEILLLANFGQPLDRPAFSQY